jgi:hypothetical protein
MRGHALASAATGLAAVLLPKCPLCLAAWLSVLGVGTGLGGALTLALRPTLWGLAAVMAALLLVRAATRLRAQARAASRP